MEASEMNCTEKKAKCLDMAISALLEHRARLLPGWLCRRVALPKGGSAARPDHVLRGHPVLPWETGGIWP